MNEALDRKATVLCVDDDHDVADLVEAILTDEGYHVSCLYDLADQALLRTVGRAEPDVVLLDGASATDYDDAWSLAADLRHRFRPVPVVMFTAHSLAVNEAKEGASGRAVEADFAAIVAKPFHIDDLIAAVAAAAGRSVAFNRGRAAEAARTKALVEALRARGASDVRASEMREWALFRDQSEALVQLYWWQTRGVYQVGRYDDAGVMEMLGQFVERDSAIDLVLPGEQPLPS
jgi:DNA-binding response OmpR family regulator